MPQELLDLLIKVLDFAAVSGILVCISALSHRHRTALFGCYCAASGLRIANSLLHLALGQVHTTFIARPWFNLLAVAIWTGVEVAGFWVLTLAAMRALAEPEGTGRSTLRLLQATDSQADKVGDG